MIFYFFFGLYIYCAFSKQAEKSQWECIFLPAVIFIFSSGYALQNSIPEKWSLFPAGCWAGGKGGGPGAAGPLLQESGDADQLPCNRHLNK